MSFEDNLAERLWEVQPINPLSDNTPDLSNSYQTNNDTNNFKASLDEQLEKMETATISQSNENLKTDIFQVSQNDLVSIQNLDQTQQNLNQTATQFSQNIAMLNESNQQNKPHSQYERISQLQIENNIKPQVQYWSSKNKVIVNKKPQITKNLYMRWVFAWICLLFAVMICGSVYHKEYCLDLVNNEFYLAEKIIPLYIKIANNMKISWYSMENSWLVAFWNDNKGNENKNNNLTDIGEDLELKSESISESEYSYKLQKAGSVQEANRVMTENCKNLSCWDCSHVDKSEIILCSSFKQVETLSDDKPRIWNSWSCRYKDDSELYYLDLNS